MDRKGGRERWRTRREEAGEEEREEIEKAWAKEIMVKARLRD